MSETKLHFSNRKMEYKKIRWSQMEFYINLNMFLDVGLEIGTDEIDCVMKIC